MQINPTSRTNPFLSRKRPKNDRTNVIVFRRPALQTNWFLHRCLWTSYHIYLHIKAVLLCTLQQSLCKSRSIRFGFWIRKFRLNKWIIFLDVSNSFRPYSPRMNSIFNEDLFAHLRSSLTVVIKPNTLTLWLLSALEKMIPFLDFLKYYGGQNSIIRPDTFTKTEHLWSENSMTVNSSYCRNDPTFSDTIALIISAWRESISKSKLASPKVSCKLFIMSDKFSSSRMIKIV